MNKVDAKDGMAPSQRITNYIAELGDWRAQCLSGCAK
jgi:hypothetical protein